MKIVHVIWALDTGGAETMLVDIINEQVKSQVVAIIVINDLINQMLLNTIDKKCKIALIRRKIGSKDIRPWIKFNICLWRFCPDIIHVHLEGMRKMIFHPAHKVFTIHNMHTSGKEYGKYEELFAISDAVRRKTLGQGFEAYTICNGIHPELISVRNTKCAPPKSMFRFVCVGRLYTPHKGQDILITALLHLSNLGITNFHLDIIGEGVSRGELEKLVKDLHIQGYVSFLGQRDRMYVYQHLRDYDLYILPSRSEGFGLTVAEAMCAGVPVLVSDLEGPMEVINYGKFGMHFKSNDPESLASQIEHFLNAGENREMTEAALVFAKDRYNIANVSNKYIEEYKNIINK